MDFKSKKKSSANVQQFNKFLNNNIQFLVSKYEQHYGKQQWNLQNVDKQKTVKFIYDVFGFGKYQNDQKMNKVLKESLAQNIKDFIKTVIDKQNKTIKKGSKKTPKSILFTSNISIELLRYCIQNNQMFAVHYDKKQSQKGQPDQQKQNQETEIKNQEKQNIQSKQLQQINNHQQKQQQSQNKKQQDNPEVINNQSKISKKHQSRVSFKDQVVQQQQNLEENQFTKNALEKLTQEQIKKKSQILFKFYCKQLHSLGGHTTFDRIDHQCQSLGLGKFMVFCQATEVFSKYTQLNKRVVINTFMKVSQGIKEIDFQKFYKLLKKLNQLDPGLFDRLGMNDDKVFKSKKKHLSKPFGTKDQEIRQLKIYEKVKVMPRQNIYTSNRVKQALRKSISRSRSRNGLQQSIQCKNPQNNVNNESTRYLKQDQNGSTYINPNEVSRLSNAHLEEQVDLGFLSKLINAQDADDQWLGQYKVPLKRSKILINTNKAAISSIRTSRPRQHIDHFSDISIDQSVHIASGIKTGIKTGNRKDNLLLGMKNRIKQLQFSQKRNQLTNRKRVSLSLLKNK